VPVADDRHQPWRDAATLTDALDDWLRDNPPPPSAPDPATRFAQLRDWQRRLHEGGWIGYGWSREHGGQGGTWADQALVYSHLALREAPLPVGIVGLQSVGPALIRHGTEEQRRHYLPRILDARDVWCQGFSEPDAGSDLAALRTSARRIEDGYVVNGQKVWTSWAQYADLCAVLVRTGTAEERHRGLTYLIVPVSAEGVEVRPIAQMTGESEFNELFLQDVTVPSDALIGVEGAGWQVALSTLDFERATYAVSRSADLRVAFDRILAAAPADAVIPARDVGWAEVTLYAMRALSHAAGRDLARGDIGPRSATYKLLTSQLEQDVAQHARAVIDHSPAAWLQSAGDARALAQHHYLAGRSATIHGGTAEVLRGVIAERLLSLPRSR
jgi:alkylation response protein AidB-like acyl-CoA dehydrogenase